MNNNIDYLLEHRSIRSWTDERIDDGLVEKLLEVANRTSTSNGMQNASIIRVKDPEKRQALAKLANQKYLATAPELLIFIVDNYRNTRIMEERQADKIYAHDADKFFQGWTDACLMAQNISVAAEMNGLGIVYFGSILNDCKEVIKILNLPEYTFPVVGLGIGYPNQDPALKPRMDISKKVFVDEYEKKDSYLEELADYDKVMQTYYDLRDPSRALDSFTKQVVDKNSIKIAKRDEIFEAIKEQGFDF